MKESEFFEVNGVTYLRNGARFCDEFGVELVTIAEQDFAKQEYFKRIKLEELGQEDLRDFIKYTRWMGEYERSKECLFFALKKYSYDNDFVKSLLPMYLSTARNQAKDMQDSSRWGLTEEGAKQIENALKDAEEVLEQYPHLISCSIYTSILAACCDLSYLKKARTYAEKAKRLNGNRDNYKLEQAVQRLCRLEQIIMSRDEVEDENDYD